MSFSTNRGINPITSEQALEGPRDSFNEEIECNILLIKKRIHCNLNCKELFVGKYTQTKVYVLSINGICNDHLVEQISNKILSISIDGIIDSSYLKKYLLEKNYLFPTIIASERPDKCSMALLEGKVVILADNSPYALILPNFFYDFFHTADDYYQKSFNTFFIRMIRIFSFFIAIYTPAFYLSVTTRNYNLIPLSLLLTLKAGRNLVPFPAFIEALFMMIAFEILKESDLRKSNSSNSSISILGGLVLGDAAVAAGIVSPIMIIVIATASISSLIFQSNEFTNSIRFFQWLFLILSVLFGIYGILLGTFLMFFSLYQMKSFGIRYLSINSSDFYDSFIKLDTKIFRRNSQLSKNSIRGKL